MKEDHLRSVAKAISWRIGATFITAALVYLFTGKWTLAIGIGVAEFIIKAIVYYFHERIWILIPWGRQRAPEEK